MICVDTTFLIDLWRNRSSKSHPVRKIVERNQDEVFVVPAHAAGEFIEGGANISEERFREAIRFVRLFEIGEIGLETAMHYAKIVSNLRKQKLLLGISKPDVWIAAWAIEHGAVLVTGNKKHFQRIQNLELVSY
jgi:predicted nucleic acid-binding protein